MKAFRNRPQMDIRFSPPEGEANGSETLSPHTGPPDREKAVGQRGILTQTLTGSSTNRPDAIRRKEPN